MSKRITSTFYSNVKKSAKSLKKTLGIKHSEALELASKQAGYPTYHALKTAYKSQMQPEDEFIKNIRNGLINFVKGEYGCKVIEDNRTVISRHHSGAEDIHSIVLEKLLEVFDYGIDDDGTNIDAGWSVVNWAICKETIKEIGHNYAGKANIEDQIKGALLVSLGHFFRSAADSYESRRLVHPPFVIYVADWVRSITVNEESIQRLLMMYPKNEYNGIAKGTSYWKTPQ